MSRIRNFEGIAFVVKPFLLNHIIFAIDQNFLTLMSTRNIVILRKQFVIFHCMFVLLTLLKFTVLLCLHFCSSS